MIGIVVLTLNVWGETEKCLDSIFEYKPTAEKFVVYLVDNGSTVEYTEKIDKYIKKCNVVYLRSEVNEGFNGGLNIGAKKALEDGCRYCVFTNNDIYFQKDCFDIISDFYKTHEGICFPKNYDLDGNISDIGYKYFEKPWEMYYIMTPIHRAFKNMESKIRGGGLTNIQKHLFKQN